MRKRIFNRRTLVGFVMATLLLSALYVAFELSRAPTVAAPSAEGLYERVKSDYALMLTQCLLGIAALFLPGIIERRVGLMIPSPMIVVYALFLYCAIYLGEVREFYYSMPYWDTILHAFSGAMLGALGFSIVSFLNKADRIPMNLSPAFVALFTFCFALALGVIWEIYEFLIDCLLKTNMQKFRFANGELMQGQAALFDTMKDLIVDCAGALVMALIGYFSLDRQMGWPQRMQIKRQHKEEQP